MRKRWNRRMLPVCLALLLGGCTTAADPPLEGGTTGIPAETAVTEAAASGEETTEAMPLVETTPASTARPTERRTTATTAAATAASTTASAPTSAATTQRETETAPPVMKDPKKILTPNLKGRSARILILGNSFVGSSQVGTWLRSLAEENGQELEVEDVSQGFATVQTYAQGLYNFPGIPNGEYDAIFQCGFYGGQSGHLRTMAAAAAGTKTKLVMFPASNESHSDIMNSFDSVEEAGYLGWYDLIHYLWSTGEFRQDDLAYIDDFLHTNELGGYAGACMIYAYLYRELPEKTAQTRQLLRMYHPELAGRADAQGLFAKAEAAAREFVLADRPYRI